MDGLKPCQEILCAALNAKKSYMERMNKAVCDGCSKKGNCLKMLRMLIVNCLDKEEVNDNG